jgi:hypothetical protein
MANYGKVGIGEKVTLVKLVLPIREKATKINLIEKTPSIHIIQRSFGVRYLCILLIFKFESNLYRLVLPPLIRNLKRFIIFL